MILVSGGTGLIGSHLLVELLKKGESVKAIYRTEKSKEKTKKVFEFHKALTSFDNIQWLKADILDYTALKDCFADVTHVYHCAAIVSFDESLQSDILDINIEGTEKIVNLCLEFNIEKLCYVSSVAALGYQTEKKFITEHTEWHSGKSLSTYSLSKFQSENEVWRGIAEGLNAVIINPSTILGYGDWESSSLILIKKVAKGLKFYPSGINGFVGVRDVVNAMILLMKSDIKSERFIISSENLSFKSIFELIAKAFNKAAPTYEVNKKLVNFLLYIDRWSALILRTKRRLPASSLNATFEKRHFSSEKFISHFDYRFELISDVINEIAPAFKKEMR